MQDLLGKTAVITGAARGIGFALAQRCLDQKMQVVLADVSAPHLEIAKNKLQQKYSKSEVLAVATDVSKVEDLQTLAGKTLERFGRVHLLVNNAGVSATTRLMKDAPLEDWHWMLNVNLWGVIHGVHVFLPILLEQKEPCHIVNTASQAAINIFSGLGAYHVTKFGVMAITETLSKELHNSQVGVSVVCPRFTYTSISDCEENRPEEFKVDNTEETQGIVSQPPEGDTAEDVARWIMEGVANDELYIFPKNNDWVAPAKKRFDAILAAANK